MHKRGGGITVLSKFVVSRERNEKFCKGTLQFSRKTLVSKNFNCDRGYHVFPSEMFGVTVPKNFVIIPSRFPKTWGIDNFYAAEKEGVSRFSLETFCHTLPKSLVAEHFGVSEKFVYRKILCIRKGYHSTLMKDFCLTVPKNFVRELYCFWKNSGVETFCGLKKGYHVFLSKIFGLTVPKNFVQEPISVSIISGIKKCWG